MAEHLSIDILGVVHGTADGTGAVKLLAFIAVVALVLCVRHMKAR